MGTPPAPPALPPLPCPQVITPNLNSYTPLTALPPLPCPQAITPNLNRVVTELLTRIKGFQERAMAKNPVKVRGGCMPVMSYRGAGGACHAGGQGGGDCLPVMPGGRELGGGVCLPVMLGGRWGSACLWARGGCCLLFMLGSRGEVFLPAGLILSLLHPHPALLFLACASPAGSHASLVRVWPA